MGKGRIRDKQKRIFYMVEGTRKKRNRYEKKGRREAEGDRTAR